MAGPRKEEAGETVVQVMDSLGLGRGGLTRAVFDRFTLLSKSRRAILVTVAYQPQVRAVFNHLIEIGAIPQHVELLNYFEDQRSISRVLLSPVSEPHRDWETGAPFQAAVEPSAQGKTTRYSHQGLFVGLTHRNDNGVLRHVDHHSSESPWIRNYRDMCWGDGSISLREFYDEHGKPRFRVYVGSDRRAYLSVWVNDRGYEYRTVEHSGTESYFHGDMRASNTAWLERKLRLVGNCIVFNDEPRTTFSLDVQLPGVRHVAAIHTTHRKSENDLRSGLKHWVDPYLKASDNISKLVFFTESQRVEFCHDTSFSTEKSEMIAHPAPEVEKLSITDIVRDPLLVVSVSRLADDKRLDHAIRAFSKVRLREPSARFEIWGTGPARASLAELISRLKLDGCVTLKGFTSSPETQFARASLSVVTSKFEGFGLVLIESLACGTPVAAYDVKYGPHEIIDDENGRLVHDGDEDSLANAISDLLLNGTDRERAASRQTARRYSREVWARRWEDVASS